jgi:hypothetical protein
LFGFIVVVVAPPLGPPEFDDVLELLHALATSPNATSATASRVIRVLMELLVVIAGENPKRGLRYAVASVQRRPQPR